MDGGERGAYWRSDTHAEDFRGENIPGKDGGAKGE